MACLKLTLPTTNAQQNVIGAVVLSRGRALEGPRSHGISGLKDWTFSHILSQRCPSAFAFSLRRGLSGICDWTCAWQRPRKTPDWTVTRNQLV